MPTLLETAHKVAEVKNRLSNARQLYLDVQAQLAFRPSNTSEVTLSLVFGEDYDNMVEVDLHQWNKQIKADMERFEAILRGRFTILGYCAYEVAVKGIAYYAWRQNSRLASLYVLASPIINVNAQRYFDEKQSSVNCNLSSKTATVSCHIGRYLTTDHVLAVSQYLKMANPAKENKDLYITWTAYFGIILTEMVFYGTLIKVSFH